MNQKYHHGDSQLSEAPCQRESLDVLMPANYQFKRSKKRKYSWLMRRCRLTYLKILRLRGKPQVIAKGLAIGVFAGCFPFLGLQSLIGIVLATIFRGSKVAAVAATWISNPLTYVPIFVFNYKIGKLLLGIQDSQLIPLDLDIESLTTFKELGSTFAITLLTGSCMVGMILGFITYFYSLAILERLRGRSARRAKGSRHNLNRKRK
ncbi:DUF2062 domain-containing protein [Pleurocapsa sp. PCC 7319]|uniref:DUF2062 domain-containing protein n=1 Tax=Pleurocapsa sp. PCC 7319 TaxID=118161 RepID=UPI000345E084|nr:DUF2062 domain-containing protein [Pleurocapsa sp. PCC 7319]